MKTTKEEGNGIICHFHTIIPGMKASNNQRTDCLPSALSATRHSSLAEMLPPSPTCGTTQTDTEPAIGEQDDNFEYDRVEINPEAVQLGLATRKPARFSEHDLPKSVPLRQASSAPRAPSVGLHDLSSECAPCHPKDEHSTQSPALRVSAHLAQEVCSQPIPSATFGIQYKPYDRPQPDSSTGSDTYIVPRQPEFEDEIEFTQEMMSSLMENHKNSHVSEDLESESDSDFDIDIEEEYKERDSKSLLDVVTKEGNLSNTISEKKKASEISTNHAPSNIVQCTSESSSRVDEDNGCFFTQVEDVKSTPERSILDACLVFSQLVNDNENLIKEVLPPPPIVPPQTGYIRRRRRNKKLETLVEEDDEEEESEENENEDDSSSLGESVSHDESHLPIALAIPASVPASQQCKSSPPTQVNIVKRITESVPNPDSMLQTKLPQKTEIISSSTCAVLRKSGQSIQANRSPSASDTKKKTIRTAIGENLDEPTLPPKDVEEQDCDEEVWNSLTLNHRQAEPISFDIRTLKNNLLGKDEKSDFFDEVAHEKTGSLFLSKIGFLRKPQITWNDRDDLISLSQMKLDWNDVTHLSVMEALYQSVTHGVFKGFPENAAPGPKWEVIGFQGVDPSTDLRGSGLLGPLQMIQLAKDDPTLVQKIYLLSRSSVQEFPLMAVALNWSLATLQTIRQHPDFGGIASTAWDASAKLFAAFWRGMITRWEALGLKINDFPALLKELRDVAMRKPIKFIKQHLQSQSTK